MTAIIGRARREGNPEEAEFEPALNSRNDQERAFNMFRDNFSMLSRRIDDIFYPYSVTERLQFVFISSHQVRLNLFTNNYRYRISARFPEEQHNGYLGVTCTSRKSQVGEDWMRGSDLPDGPYNEETMNRVYGGIVRNEILPLDIQWIEDRTSIEPVEGE